MPGKYFAVLFISLYITICDGSTSPLKFPQCNQPLQRIMQVNRGENATLRLRLYVWSYEYHWKAHFTWAREGEKTLCILLRGESWGGRIDSKFYMAVTGDYNQSSSWHDYVNYIDFELTISKSSYIDQGIYILHSSIMTPCKILNVTIDVLDAIPLCTASLLDGK